MAAKSLGRTAIVIPVFNQIHFTRGCLETLFADSERPSYDLCVVDNNSTDGTAELLREWSARVTGERDRFQVISNRTNRGVAPAWNQGILATEAEEIVVLNNDILLPRGWAKGLAEAKKNLGLAIASPFPLEGEKPAILDDWAQTFTAKNRMQYWKEYSFVAFALSRATFKKIGLFDEKFEVGGYEDTDYIYRLREAGLAYGVVGGSTLYHYGSQTLKGFKERGDAHAIRNKSYFMEKWKLDPALEKKSLAAKWLRRWRRLKLRFGRM
jgi:GT2 family glycosyltransferase